MRPFHMVIIWIISMKDNSITRMEIIAITMALWLRRQASSKARYSITLKNRKV